MQRFTTEKSVVVLLLSLELRASQLPGSSQLTKGHGKSRLENGLGVLYR
jgi:hypothetical protein